MRYDFLALAAALCWTLGSLLSVSPSRHLGAFAYTRWRMLLVGLMLWCATLVSGGLPSLLPGEFGLVAASSLAGIVVGDTANFAAMNRLGPRRAGLLFATNALFSALLGFFIFDERMSLHALSGATLTIAGVMTAIALGTPGNDAHAWEKHRGKLATGIFLGLVAALGQAAGALLVKPVMTAGADPIAISAIRVSLACLAHFFILWTGFSPARATHPVQWRVLAQTAASGTIGMGLGMTFLLLALREGDVGIVSILSSISPILILPLLWLRFGRAPAVGAWLGAGLTVLGTILLLSR